jgi:cytochrome P450
MVHQEGEEHRRLRALAHQSFTPKVVDTMRDRIQAIVDTLLEPFRPGGRMELVSDFAYRLPLIVMWWCSPPPTATQSGFRNQTASTSLAPTSSTSASASAPTSACAPF